MSDDLDLDKLMTRVREAAMAGGTSGAAARRHNGGEVNGDAIDLLRVLDAQGEWNEHTRQSLTALVDCLRTLRDDWLDANARLREELGELSALVAELKAARTTTRPAAKRRSSKARRRRS